MAESLVTEKVSPKTGGPEHSTRTVRVDVETWERAKARASSEGRTISRATAELVRGYADGFYDLPVIKTIREYPAAKQSIPQD